MAITGHLYLNEPSWQVDVFSFGIALWEILTGEEPYINMHCGAIIGKLFVYINLIVYMEPIIAIAYV